jgi:hypothetical protein
MIDPERTYMMRQHRLMKNVKGFLKLYVTKDSFYFGKPDRLQLALTALLKDLYSESEIKSLHSKYIRDIKKKVSFTNASKSFFTSLIKETDLSHSSEVASKKKIKAKKIRKDTSSVKNRKTNKYKKK